MRAAAARFPLPPSVLWPGEEEEEEESQGLVFFFTVAVMQQDCLLVCMPVPY